MKRRNQNDRTNRRWLGVALPAVALVACLVAFFYHGPSRSSSRVARPAERAAEFSPHVPQPVAGMRPVYPYSVIPGGAYSAAELKSRLRSDSVAARHYEKFRLAQVRRIETESASLVYVSYRKRDSIFWTRKRIRLARGEKLLTDGVLYARARCGNRISTTPEGPVALLDPPDYIFERPETWQPEPRILPPPPDNPVESRSRTPETVSPLPLNPGRETVAKKHAPFFPLFPFPLPIGGGSGGKGGPVVTKPGTGGGGGKPGTGGGGGNPGGPGGGGNPGGPGGGGGGGGDPGGPGGGGGGNPGGPGGCGGGNP